VSAEIVKGSNGSVILRGQVQNTSERKRLHDSIANLPGVNQVDDQVTVGSPNGNGTIHFGNNAAQQ
jgi:osmotically-inducible protein OsmY